MITYCGTGCGMSMLLDSCGQMSSSFTNDFEVTIKEALHIKNSKPALNRQLFNSGSSFVLNIF